MKYHSIWIVLALMAAPVLIGCTKGMKSFETVRIILDEQIVDSAGQVPTFDVELVGLRPDNSNDQALVQQNVNSYFDQDLVRKDLRASKQAVTQSFTRGIDREVTVQIPWSEWRTMGVRQLMVIDELHRRLSEAQGQVGPEHRRRQVIPLEADRWEGGQNVLTIRVQRSGVEYQPQPRPPK